MAEENTKPNGDGPPEKTERAITIAGELALSVKHLDKLIAKSKTAGRGWSTEKAIGHLLWHMFTKRGLCPICCLTQQFFHSNKTTQAAMRRRMPVLFTHMLRRHNLLLIKDYAPVGNGFHGEVQAVGIYNPKTADPHEQNLMRAQLSRMTTRRQITKSDVLLAGKLTGFLEDGNGPETSPV
jgi:hypothetical protein